MLSFRDWNASSFLSGSSRPREPRKGGCEWQNGRSPPRTRGRHRRDDFRLVTGLLRTINRGEDSRSRSAPDHRGREDPARLPAANRARHRLRSCAERPENIEYTMLLTLILVDGHGAPPSLPKAQPSLLSGPGRINCQPPKRRTDSAKRLTMWRADRVES